jgi:hypothetical protein
MPAMRPCVAGLLFCASCLDFGKFGLDGGGGQGGDVTGGTSTSTSGGAGQGGQGGSVMPVCPSDPPPDPCVTDADGFNGEDVPDWEPYPGTQLFRANCPGTDQSDCGLKVKSTPPARNVLRTKDASQVDTCSASIRLETVAEEGWTLLELSPDQDEEGVPALGQRAEVAVRPGKVRFIVAGTETQELVLPAEAVVDALRIQVRPGGLALEALDGGVVVGCFLAERPPGFKEQVRVGIGLDAKDEEGDEKSSTFDDYGLVR